MGFRYRCIGGYAKVTDKGVGLGDYVGGFSGRGFGVRDLGLRVQSSKFSDLAFRGSGLGCSGERERDRASERERERERKRARQRDRERERDASRSSNMIQVLGGLGLVA